MKSVGAIDRGLHGILLWNFCEVFKNVVQEAEHRRNTLTRTPLSGEN